MDRRQLLISAGAVFAAPPALARPSLEGAARREAGNLVDLDWSPASAPATVRVAADPDAAPSTMRLLQAGVRGGRLEVREPRTPRPYFLISTTDGGQLRLAERLLPLQGGRNFRDLGGYGGAAGRRVRWGRIYRSGAMAGLTAADMEYLSDLGIGVICDLRSREERAAVPSPFPPGGQPRVVATDYEMFDFMDIRRATNRAEAIEAFAEVYVQFTQILAPQYADMFERLVGGEAPLVMNCSAGKDRTGMAAALILSVLGASRGTVLADYALTQLYTPPASLAAGPARGIPAAHREAFARMPPEVLAVMAGSDPEVMASALGKIDRRYGGPIPLAKARLGLSDAKIARMRRTYLA